MCVREYPIVTHELRQIPFYDKIVKTNKKVQMKKAKKIQKEEKTVISNIDYLKTLTHDQRREIYKKMLGINTLSLKTK